MPAGRALGGGMIIEILVVGIVGILLPLSLKKLNIDPAVASSIFVTTFTGATGFLSFPAPATLLIDSRR